MKTIANHMVRLAFLLILVFGAYSPIVQSPVVPASAAVTTRGAALVTNALKVVIGYTHACALLPYGGVKCWGKNLYGELGNGDYDFRWLPSDVTGLTTGMIDIAIRDDGGCALTAQGTVKCWGVAPLGDGIMYDSNTPKDVVGLSSVVAISGGGNHMCALTSGGKVKCWGENISGEIGDGTQNTAYAPVDVVGLPAGITAISAGGSHTCALTAGSGVKCWGENSSGQLGNASNSTSYTPVDVVSLTSGVSKISAGVNHTCAVTTTGAAKCWGYNTYGQLGDGSYSSRAVPGLVSGLSSGVATIAAGRTSSCAITTGGAALCWGNNQNGQLGNGDHLNRLTPANVVGLSGGVSAIHAGGDMQTCAIQNGYLYCWGKNDGFTSLASGFPAFETTPKDALGVNHDMQAISTGKFHTCALTTGGGVKCWGWNSSTGITPIPDYGGQLGSDDYAQRLIPADVSGLTGGVIAIAAGYEYTCALTSAGGVKCWGQNELGQLGDGTFTAHKLPADVSGLTSGVIAISAYASHTCALTSGHGLKCWGYNLSGQLGNGTTGYASTPVDVTGLTSGVASVSVGVEHTCAVTTTGGAKCWGNNSLGAIGDGTQYNQRKIPVDVSGLTSGVTAIQAGNNSTCAIVNGGAKCWGYNEYGKVGDGTHTDRIVPTDVYDLASGVSALAVGPNHACALTTAGQAKCWGRNASGELGDGTTSDHTVPMLVSGLTSGVTAISANGESEKGRTCVVANNGSLKCWGDNQYGQLGNGGAVVQAIPVAVYGLGALPSQDKFMFLPAIRK
jgi:alpha-tubulin suppressor-like RCC1 family protein